MVVQKRNDPINPPMVALSLSNVSVTFPARRRQPAGEALRSITLEIPAGQSVALLGPNGSGKSTLIRVIAGVLSATSGEAQLFARPPHAARDLLGVVFQNPGLDRHMTVWENLRDSAALYGLEKATAQTLADALLSDLRLSDRRDALVKTLSGGMARRVDLCRALLTQPRMLILDEPTTGLDPVARREFIVQLATRRAAGDITLLMSTHLIDEADGMDRVLMLHEGRIVADGRPAELRQQLGVRRVTVQDVNWSPPSSEATAWSRVSGSGGWVRDLNQEAEAPAIARVLAATSVPFSIAPPTLGDVFERLTGSSLESAAVETPQPGGRRRRESAH